MALDFRCGRVSAIILGVVAMFLSTDRPADAHWLTPQERGVGRYPCLNATASQRKPTQELPVVQAFRSET